MDVEKVYTAIPFILSIILAIVGVYFLYLRSKMKTKSKKDFEMVEALIMLILAVVFAMVGFIAMDQYGYYI